MSEHDNPTVILRCDLPDCQGKCMVTEKVINERDRQVVLMNDGSVAYVRMTRKAFYKVHTDYRNSPGRTDAPMLLQLCPKSGATCLVQAMFTCEHFTPEKVRCEECAS